jgi:hypothetical protein
MAKTKVTKETQFVHFRIGENFGALLMSIAQEHLTERNNPVLALKTITESLHGCPTDLAVQILKGSVVLLVDEETQTVSPVERTNALDKIFPKINPLYFIDSRAGKIKEYGGYIIDGFKALQYEVRKSRGYFDISFKYEDVFKFVAGDNEALLEELRDNRDIDGIASLFETTKKFIEETMRTQSTMDWIMQTFDEFKEPKNYETYLKLRGEVADTLTDIAFYLNQTLKLEFSLDAPADNVQNYIEAAREIDEVLSKGIEPVNIMDDWSAGWLAPNGDYYGLNGEIANMLHNQIADALQEKGIVPKKPDEEVGAEINPDQWLEEHGWVKIHLNNVQFSGCNNFRLSKPNVDLTNVQIEKIFKYIHELHMDVIKVGWRLDPITITMFQRMAENDLPALYKRYFEF